MNKYIPERIAALDEYRADNAKYRIRLDANESPFAPSDDLLCDFIESVSRVSVNRYPDSSAAVAVSAFAKCYSLKDENIAAGNGSDELISIIENCFLGEHSRVLTLTPDFSMYGFYASLRGAEVIEYKKNDKFEIDFEAVFEIIGREKINLVIFSNPCNPTGRVYEREVLLNFVRRAGIVVVVDEAYGEFCKKDYSLLHDTEKFDNLIVLKTLSKALGIASMRCGFAVSNTEIISALMKTKSPYNVNGMSQQYAAAVLARKEETNENIEYILNEKARIESTFGVLAKKFGFEVFPTDTNFVLLKFGGDRAKEIYDKLCEAGIKVRLLPPCLRITAGTKKENDEMLREFENIIGGTK